MSERIKMINDYGVVAEANVPRDLVDIWEAQGWKILSPVEPKMKPSKGNKK